MTDPRPPQRHSTPASQRHRTQQPAPEQPDVVDQVDEQPDVAPEPEPEDEPTPELEHPTCWACGWLLHTSIAGDLYCIHPSCAQRHIVVGTLVTDRAAADRLREAIAQANGEQSSDRPRPSPEPRTEPIPAQPPLY